MGYLEETLIFESDKIYFTDEAFGGDREVMMDWENSLMSASAAYVCKGGGDILEIGFGMRISASYIQAHSINSHTIVENHPQIIEKAKAWAANKSNVTIIENDWHSVKDSLSTYDGIFYDTFGDQNMNKFSSSLSGLVKEGAKVTWWNNEPSETNFYDIPNVTYQTLDINPPVNNYFNSNKYYLPLKEF